jgi:hypothetical protein
MTLADLYDTIDWSDTEEALESWKSKSMDKMPEESYDDFSRKWRCTLIAYALPTEVTETAPPGWTPERQAHARQALSMAGVWDKIVDMLITHGLLEGQPLVKQEN